ncbi:MAG TPA: hypothetical protein VEY92_01785 [Pseudoxanthomonas sp.]|nr:hypothetical protein [Pseudoxanthomonas sp.]
MSNSKPVALALSGALIGGLALSGSAFAMQSLPQGYLLSATAHDHAGAAKATDNTTATASGAANGKTAEGRCGEGKCGAGMRKGDDAKAQHTEANRAQSKRGEEAKQDGAAKAGHAEGKCGEGKCGGGA